jgi:hypothetical protein
VAELTPSEWFDKLDSKFTETTRVKWADKSPRPDEPALWPRNAALDHLWSYYVGDPPLPSIDEEYEDVFRDVMRKSRCNYAPMCVNAMLDRMSLQAVSTGKDSSSNGDDVAAEIMDNSGFAAQFKDLLTFVFAMREGYMMVVPTDDGPMIHAIDPRRCVSVVDPKNPLRLLAALVREFDETTNEDVAHLFLPGEKWELRRSLEQPEWKRISDTPTELVKGLDDLGGIPLVRFDNAHGLGEYEAHIDVLDRIIDTTLQRIVLAKYQAFKQRGVSGDEDEETNYEDLTEDETQALVGGTGFDDKRKVDWKDVFQAGPGKVWKVPAGWDFWESGQADMAGMLQAKRDDAKEFAAVTFTPLYLITPDDANGSAAGAGLLREGLTSKVRDRRDRTSPRLKLLWRIAFAMQGDAERGQKIQLHWGPIEFRSLAEKGSATSQAVNVLSRRRILSEIWEMTPQEIEDNENELAAEALLAASLAPQPPQQAASAPAGGSASATPAVNPPNPPNPNDPAATAA